MGLVDVCFLLFAHQCIVMFYNRYLLYLGLKMYYYLHFIVSFIEQFLLFREIKLYIANFSQHFHEIDEEHIT